MAFKETKGNKTIEARVKPAPGGMFKGFISITTTTNKQTRVESSGRHCGRPVKTEEAALELAEAEGRRVLAVK
jgi:hypothetical protein